MNYLYISNLNYIIIPKLAAEIRREIQLDCINETYQGSELLQKTASGETDWLLESTLTSPQLSSNQQSLEQLEIDLSNQSLNLDQSMASNNSRSKSYILSNAFTNIRHEGMKQFIYFLFSSVIIQLI